MRGDNAVVDVSPKLNSPDHSSDESPESISDILRTANALKVAVDNLAASLAGGTGIQRAEARDHFEIALTDFSQAINETAE
jgi:hypothetical protein